MNLPSNFEFDHLAVIDTLSNFKQRYYYMMRLVETNYNFKKEPQPEAWVQRLVYSDDVPNPKLIRTFIIRAFGVNGLCTDMSSLHGYPITIVDALSDFVVTSDQVDSVIAQTMLLLIETELTKPKKK